MPLRLVNPTGPGTSVTSYSGPIRVLIATWTMSAIYSTGGERVTLPAGIARVVKGVYPQPTSGYVFEYLSTGKLKAYVSGAAGSPFQEVAAATDLSTLTVSLLCMVE